MKQANTSNKQDTREQLIEKYKKENNVQIKANIDREIYGLDKFKQGYAKALENEIDFLEGNEECNCCHKVNYWIRLRIKSLKQEIAKLEKK